MEPKLNIYTYQKYLEHALYEQIKVQVPDLIYDYRFYFDKINFCQVEFHSPKQDLYGKMYVHIDGLNLHNKDKLLKDCLKLIAIERVLIKSNRKMKKILLITDKKVKEDLEKSWINYVINDFKIQLMLIELPEKEKHRIRLLIEHQHINKSSRETSVE